MTDLAFDLARADVSLEELTAQLVCLTAHPPAVESVSLRTGGDWDVYFFGGEEFLRIELASCDHLPLGRQPNDYQLALIYRSNFERHNARHGSIQFEVEYALHKGMRWEEQMLREMALEVLGLLWYALGCHELEAYRVEAAAARRRGLRAPGRKRK
jgi:hypothetical protein